MIPRAEVSILGVDIDPICADSLGVTAVLLLVFLGLRDQILTLIARIPVIPSRKEKPFRTDTLILALNSTAAAIPGSIRSLSQSSWQASCAKGLLARSRLAPLATPLQNPTDF
jgi:hypothetical protein